MDSLPRARRLTGKAAGLKPRSWEFDSPRAYHIIGESMTGFNLFRRNSPANWEYLNDVRKLRRGNGYHLPGDITLDSILSTYDADKTLNEFIESLPDPHIAAISMDNRCYSSNIFRKDRWVFLAFVFYQRFASEFTQMALTWLKENGSADAIGKSYGEYYFSYIKDMSEPGLEKLLMYGSEIQCSHHVMNARNIVKDLRLAVIDYHYPPLIDQECQRRNLTEKVKEIKQKMRTQTKLHESKEKKIKQDREQRIELGLTGVYFLRVETEDPLIKIGYSTNIPSRVRDVQGQVPYPTTHLASIPGANFQDEKKLHRRFEKMKVKGEWFRPGEELLAFIDEVRGVEQEAT